MVKITIVKNNIFFTLVGLHKIWSFKNKITIPTSHIVSVDIYDDKSQTWWKALRVLGTNIPYLIKAGTFRKNGMNIFLDIVDPKKSIIISLKNEFYKEIIIEVNDVDTELIKLKSIIRLNAS